MTKPILQCPVCYKRTENKCSHINCPNRKPITAQSPQGDGVIDLGNGRTVIVSNARDWE